MNILLIILLVIVGIIVLFLLVAAVTGKEMVIERSIVINKPLPQVFDYIKYIKNHDNFSIWAMMDPGMKREYRGTDGMEGFVFSWDSSKNKNVGAGEQEIKKIVPNQRIEFDLRFSRPMKNLAKAKM